MKRLLPVVLMLIFVLGLSACSSSPVAFDNDVVLTVRQIAEIEQALTPENDPSANQKGPEGRWFTSIHIFGTSYTDDDVFEVYAWELSEDLSADGEAGEIKNNSGASHSVVVTARLIDGSVEVIKVAYPPSEGAGHVFPEKYQDQERSTPEIMDALAASNIEKATAYFG